MRDKDGRPIPARVKFHYGLAVTCPTCDSDPGRHCKDMDMTAVHFTRAMAADYQR